MTELSDAELIAAEEGEVGEPDEEEEAEEQFEDPEPAPEPENKLSTEAVLERDKQLESEHKRHETRLQTLHGKEEWENYSMCPLCIGDGYLTPWANGEMPDEQYAAITALSGHVPSIELKVDSDYQGCEHCDGVGETMISEPNPRRVTKQCDKCLGLGYVQRIHVPQYPVPAPIQQNGTEPASIPSQWGSPAPDDQWGRSAGHPHYGIDPKYAGLTG